MITRKRKIFAGIFLILFATVAAAQFFGIPRRVFSMIITNNLEVEGALDVQGTIADSTGNLTIIDDVDITGTLLVNGASPGNIILTAHKTADLGRSNNTVSDDPDLCVTLVSGTNYAVEATLAVINASSTPDIRVNLEGPTTGLISWAAMESNSSDIDTNGATRLSTDGFAFFPLIAGENTIIYIAGSWDPTASGSLCIQWAQNSTNATVTTMRALSWLRASAL